MEDRSGGEKLRVVPWNKPEPPTEEEAEALLSKEGYHAFRWHDVPGSVYPKHRHDCDECIWVLKGEITFGVNGEDYTLKTGDRLYLPSMKAHTARVPNDKGVTYLVGQKRLK